MNVRNIGKASSRILFLSGPLSKATMPFARNLVMAHLLAPDQFGLAVSLSVVLSMIEICSDFGFDRSIQRSVPGRETIRRNTLHMLNLLRGLALSAFLVLAGPTIANLLGAPQAAWAFSLAGVGGILRGFTNLGVMELNREYIYWVESVVWAAGELTWTLLLIFFSLIIGDYRCMLFSIIGAQTVFAILSHILSPYPWRLGFDMDTMKEVLKFGAPLVPSGFASAAKSMGDRLVVATFLGLEAVALYSVVIMSALMPTTIIKRFFSTVCMPYFINSGLDNARESRLFDVFAMMLSMFATAYCIFLITLGKPAIGLVFGANFEPSQVLVDVIALNVAVKIMYAMYVPSTLAFGHTRFMLIGSLGGLVGLGIGTCLVMITNSLTWMLVGITATELSVLVIIIKRVSRVYDFSSRGFLYALAIPLLMSGLTSVVLEVYNLVSFIQRIELLSIALMIGVVLWVVALKSICLQAHMVFRLVRPPPRVRDALAP